MKVRGPAPAPAVHRWDGGLTWIAHPEETMRRASHALAVDGDVWVVEPVDAQGVDDLLADLGAVAGVVVLADYHRRDAAAVARRHGVAVHLPGTVGHLAATVDGPVETFDTALGDTGFEAVPLYDGLPWNEAALHHPGRGTLLATEALVTSPRLTGGGERLAVTPYVRLLPPREALADRHVERVLSGHGTPVHSEAGAALEGALRRARTGAPAAILGNLPYLLRAVGVALRD